MNITDASAWLDLVIARAAALRDAGILSISFEGAHVALAPPPPPPLDLETAPGPSVILDPMEDPATFGGVLPGYRIPSAQPTALEDLP